MKKILLVFLGILLFASFANSGITNNDVASQIITGFLEPAIPLENLTIAINEVELNNPGFDTEEFLELYNYGDFDINISKWKIRDKNGTEKIIPLGTIISQKDFYVFDESIDILSFDNEENITLKDELNRIIDFTPILYDADNDNKTWQRLPDGTGNFVFKLETKSYTNALPLHKFNLTIHSPENKIYAERKIPLNISLSKEIKLLDYKKSSDIFGWRYLCRNCDEYGFLKERDKFFKEGTNNLFLRAIDNLGNLEEENIEFFVDSRDPWIYNIDSEQINLANWTFKVKFREVNPEVLTLFYGTTEKILDITNDCVQNTETYECNINEDLSLYDGQAVEYWFSVEDIAGNQDESWHRDIGLIDITPPVINNPDSFWVQGQGRDSKYIYFNIDVTEPNFDKITYEYPDSFGNLRDRRLCSRLENNICEEREFFWEGYHDITLTVLDKAGNSVEENIEFFVDSRDPWIYNIDSEQINLANWNFKVKFREVNPEVLTLFYGTTEKILDITNDCVQNTETYECSINEDLSLYDGQAVEYWFSVEDIAGNQDESWHRDIGLIDITPPVINNPDAFWVQGQGRDNKYIYFNIDVTEPNFDKITYSYIDSFGNLRDRRLCSRLENNICEEREFFWKGHYDLTLTVLDKAGNSVELPLSFDVE